MHRPNPLSNRSGFSLIEMVVVLVLIFVIASFAVPSMQNYVGHGKNRRALDRVASDIALARMAAVRAGQRATITFTGSGYTIQLQTNPVKTVRQVSLSSEYGGATVTAPTVDGTLVFDSRGLLVSSGLGPVVVRVGDTADSAFVTGAGRVYRAF
jgi:prepilin-type N-terminal cleavage/methylation domain-containing protein